MTSSKLPRLLRKESNQEIEYLFPQEDKSTQSAPAFVETTQSPTKVEPPPPPPPFGVPISKTATPQQQQAATKIQKLVRMWIAKKELDRRSRRTKENIEIC